MTAAILSPEALPSLAHLLVLGIEMLGSLVMAYYVVLAWAALLKDRNRPAARLLLAEGAINILSFKLAATLLKTLYLHSWSQIALLAAIVLLRTWLKRVFLWEQNHIRHGFRQSATGAEQS